LVEESLADEGDAVGDGELLGATVGVPTNVAGKAFWKDLAKVGFSSSLRRLLWGSKPLDDILGTVTNNVT